MALILSASSKSKMPYGTFGIINDGSYGGTVGCDNNSTVKYSNANFVNFTGFTTENTGSRCNFTPTFDCKVVVYQSNTETEYNVTANTATDVGATTSPLVAYIYTD